MTKLLTIPEVADRLALGRSTVYRMLGSHIPVYRLPNGKARVSEEDLERFLAGCRKREKPELMTRPAPRRGERRGTFARSLEAVEGGS